PRKNDLRRRRAVSLGDLGEWAAAVAAQREEGDEHDAFVREVVDDVLVPALREVVLVLDGGDRHDLAGPLDLVDLDLGESDVPDLPAVPVLLDGVEALLERRLRVDPVQVVEGDAVRPQAAKALLDLSPQHLGTAVPGAPPALRRDNAIVRNRRESSTDRLFTLASGVCVGGVDVAHPGGDRLLHEGDVLRCIPESIRAEPDPDYLGVTLASVSASCSWLDVPLLAVTYCYPPLPRITRR